jgi:16S rRNA (uracil1498-N3)-methyltransferase
MRVPRLQIVDAMPGTDVPLAGDRAHHLLDVLRLRSGDAVEVFDGRGQRFRGTLVATDRRDARVTIGEPLPSLPPSPLRPVLVQGIAQGDRMDFVVEKACELGAVRIVPVFCERTTVRLDERRAERRLSHWRRIAEAACMQSGRDDLPDVAAPHPLREWLAATPARPAARRLLLSPRAERPLSHAEVDPALPVELLVGPESGFTDDEVRACRDAGYESVRLGARTLRTETAGLAALAALQALAGDY